MRYWLHNERAKDPDAFDETVRQVCRLYQAAPTLHQKGTYVISTDEKTSIQALERAQPSQPMAPGQIERQEFEYRRHGTQSLMANFEVATGQVVTPSIGSTRTEADFAHHILQTVATDLDAEWIFVVDQLNTHQSESLVYLVAALCDLDDELGEKGQWGILQSKATRAAFLAEETHRIRFVYTPKHTSWLNQIELWFSILARRLLKRASFTSVHDLKQQLLDFIDYFNRTMAKPFKWTYAGRPLVS